MFFEKSGRLPLNAHDAPAWRIGGLGMDSRFTKGGVVHEGAMLADVKHEKRTVAAGFVEPPFGFGSCGLDVAECLLPVRTADQPAFLPAAGSRLAHALEDGIEIVARIDREGALAQDYSIDHV